MKFFLMLIYARPIPTLDFDDDDGGKPEDMKSGAMPCEDIANVMESQSHNYS